MNEKRRYPRYDLRLRGELEVANPIKEIDFVTINISAGGALIHTGDGVFLYPKDLVRITLRVSSGKIREITGAEGKVSLRGTVVREVPHGAAIHFEKWRYDNGDQGAG